MHSMLCIPLAVASLGIWCGLAPRVWAASITTGPLPRAMVVAPDDTPTTYYIRDMDGRILTVEMPPLGSPAFQASDSTQGTVEVTVLAIDSTTNQVKVRTGAGQTLVLLLTPEAIAGLQVGEPFTLNIVQRLWQ